MEVYYKKIFLIFIICITAIIRVQGNACAAEEVPLDSADIKLEDGKIYTISNLQELYHFSEIMKQASYEYFEGVTVKLVDDIVINEGVFSTDEKIGEYAEYNPLYNGERITQDTEIITWEPIAFGNGSTFRGIFDGNGHSISGIYYNNSSGNYVGLFAGINTATVQNLTIENSYIRGRCCGALAGGLYGTTVKNCTMDAIVVGNGPAGALAGKISRGENSEGLKIHAEIENCINRGRVAGGCAPGWSLGFGFSTIGGIGGYVEYANLYACANEGTVTADSAVGAIAGVIEDGNVTAVDCANEGAVKDRDGVSRLYGQGQLHQHDFSTRKLYNDIDHGNVCSCGQIKNAEKHNLGEKKIVKEPTFLNTGERAQACSICAGEVKEIIAKRTDYVKLRAAVTYLDVFDKDASDKGSIILDEEATRKAGTLLEYDRTGTYILVDKKGPVVYRINPADGYTMQSIRVPGCTITQKKTDLIELTSFSGNTQITVIWSEEPKEEIEINYTLEWPNRNGYVDYDHHHQRLYIGTDPGYQIKDVVVNGVSLGAVTIVQLKDGDDVKVYFEKIGASDEDATDGNTSGASVSKEKLIAGVKATTIKASSVNVVGTKIRVVWKKSPGYKVDYYQIFRSTKRNSGYGTKPIYTTKTGKATKYTNSKNLKVGTRYYYKVRGVRVIDGKKYYTKWSNKANHTAIYTPQASGKY